METIERVIFHFEVRASLQHNAYASLRQYSSVRGLSGLFVALSGYSTAATEVEYTDQVPARYCSVINAIASLDLCTARLTQQISATKL